MNDLQLNACVKELGSNAEKRFKGCVCIDELPQDIQVGQFCFINSLKRADSKNSIGHWTLLCYGAAVPQNDAEDDKMIFYDSFGRWPEDLGLIKYCLAHSSFVLYNNFSVQSLFSDQCGKHILYVL